MVLNKYIKVNNIIHEVTIYGIDDIRNLIPDYDKLFSIYQYNEEFINKFNSNIEKLNNEKRDINIRYQKKYNSYGNRPKLNRTITQNINSYETKKEGTTINIYYDLTCKYNDDKDITLNRYIVTYHLIKKFTKLGYNIKFTPVLFLKAFDTIENNEYIFIKFDNLDVDTINKYNIITNNEVSRILLPEIVKYLPIKNIEALDYNGYLLERHEKENIIELKNNDLLIDIFTSDNLFNGNIAHDSEVFYKKLKL